MMKKMSLLVSNHSVIILEGVIAVNKKMIKKYRSGNFMSSGRTFYSVKFQVTEKKSYNFAV